MDFRAAKSLGNVEEYLGGWNDHVCTVGLQAIETDTLLDSEWLQFVVNLLQIVYGQYVVAAFLRLLVKHARELVDISARADDDDVGILFGISLKVARHGLYGVGTYGSA